jgi:hypothetical protein
MHRLLTILTISMVLLGMSPRAEAGTMSLQWLDCSPTSRLWAVCWRGSWNVLGGKHLDKASSNSGPWTRVRSFVADNNCEFPAQNLRWYRIAKPTLPFGFRTLASIWVPKCGCPNASFQ